MTIIHNGVAATSEDQTALDNAACKRAIATLFKHYPGHDWQVDVAGGVMNIKNANLSTNYGFVQRMDEITPRNFDNKVMMGGGEILERFGMPSGKMDIQIYQELPKNLRGEIERNLS